MLLSKGIEDRLRKGRLDAKTRDSLFRRKIEQGANCAPLVSQAILDTVKDVFPLDGDDPACQLDLGRIKLLVVVADEPAGKSLKECQKVPVLLTLDAGADDAEVRAYNGIAALRRARLLRLCVEAREQGGLLSYEDLAYRLFNCGVRTLSAMWPNCGEKDSSSPLAASSKTWSAAVEVMDDNPRHRGNWADGASGMGRLLVGSRSHGVGLILGFEISRAAGSREDGHAWLEGDASCRRLATEVDGACDPSDDKQRLLWGLKRTNGEVRRCWAIYAETDQLVCRPCLSESFPRYPQRPNKASPPRKTRYKRKPDLSTDGILAALHRQFSRCTLTESRGTPGVRYIPTQTKLTPIRTTCQVALSRTVHGFVATFARRWHSDEIP